MTLWEALFFGIVEGITEYLPISSTFHLLLTKRILNLSQNLFLDNYLVIIQSGAIAAAVFLYTKKILQNLHLFKSLVISFIPTGIIAFLLNDIIKFQFFPNQPLQIITFIVVGLLFITTEYFLKNRQPTLSSNQISINIAILIGVAQSLAIIPGVSRSGAILLAMLWLGFKRFEAAEYSFMLGIPTIFAASAFDLLDLIQTNQLSNLGIMPLIVGWACAFIVAYLSMKWLIQYLQHHTLTFFGIYRIVIGTIALVLLI